MCIPGLEDLDSTAADTGTYTADDALGGATLGADAGESLYTAGDTLGGAALGADAAADPWSWGSGDTLAASLNGAGGATAGTDPMSTLAGYGKYISPALSIGSGLLGLQRQAQLKKMAQLAAARGDPWGNSGGRALADSQLQQLLRDPSSVAASDPAYKLRIQGAQRATSQYGQDSGAMSIAGANASTDWYNGRLAQLAGLSGAGTTPGNGMGTALIGLTASNNLLSSSLGSIGYAGAGGGNTGLNSAQTQALLNLALKRAGG